MTICQRCGKEFERKLCQAHLKRNPPKYCSRKCGHPNQFSQVPLTCVQCGTTFHRKKYMAEWSKERGPFCGFPCYALWQKENNVGPNNPCWKEDSVDRSAGKFQLIRRLAIQRDHGRCRICGSTGKFHIHHIENPDLHELDNVLTLCASCHRKLHPVPHGQDGRFQSIR